MPLADANAREQALDLHQHVLVQAPAGSGKTGLLIQRLLACLAVVERPEQIVAITFTRKAAAEMRHRLSLALTAATGDKPTEAHAQKTWLLARQALERDQACQWRLRENPSRLRIQTIDSLNQYLAVQAPLLSGLAGGNTTEDARLLYRKAILRLFAGLERKDTEATLRAALEQVLMHFGNRLDRAVSLLEGMLTSREQWLPLVMQSASQSEQAWNAILDALVTSRLEAAAAQLPMDLADRFAAAVARAADPDELPLMPHLTEWPAHTAGNLAVLQGLAGLIVKQDGEYRSQLNKTNGFPKGEATTALKAVLLEWHEQGEALREALNDIVSLPDCEYPADLAPLRDDLCLVLGSLVAELKLVFATQGEVDFPEVAARARWALQQGDTYTPVMERQHQQIQHLLVDEMQDTSQSQLALLELLTAGWSPGDGRSLFMVGDPMQSIYAFRQAEVRLFLAMMAEQRLGDLPLKVLALSANFRSQGGLVDWFNESFDAVFPAQQDVWRGLASYRPSTSVRPALEQDAACWHVAVQSDAVEESRRVVEVLKQIEATEPEASTAVLVRARTHLVEILNALRNAGIAYQCQDVDPVASMPAVADALGLIRACWHVADVTAWTILLRAPFVGLSWEDLTRIAIQRHANSLSGAASQDVQGAMRSVLDAGQLSDEGTKRTRRLLSVLDSALDSPRLQRAFPARVKSIWHELAAAPCYDASELADVERLFALLDRQCPRGELEDVADFSNQVQRLFAQPGNQGVQVMTMHKSKGLEFDHVLLPGLGKSPRPEDAPLLANEALAEGCLLAPKPRETHSNAAERLYGYITTVQKTRQRAETLRLLYVAATRARRQLHLFASADLNKDGEIKPASGSLLAALWPVAEVQFAQLALPDDASETRDAPEPQWVLPIRRRCDSSVAPLLADPVWQARPVPRTTREERADTTATLIGGMYHAAMEKMIRDGAWPDQGLSRKTAMAAGFRRSGMPEPQVDAAVQRVLALLARTLASESGQWLLKSRQWVRVEYALEGQIGDRMASVRLDLCFQDGEDYWVVDYKAAMDPVAEQDVADYVMRQRERYAGQLHDYAALLAADRNVSQVRTALFLPELGRLEELT